MKKFLTLIFLVLSSQQVISQSPYGNLNNVAYDSSACGLNFIHKAGLVATRGGGNGMPITLNVSELPASNYIIEKAFVWSTVSYVSDTPTNVKDTVIDPNGNVRIVTAVLTGQQGPKCWGEIGTRGYRSDVTNSITGNGNYRISTNTSDIWTDGLTLLIIYRNLAESYTGHLIIHDGLYTTLADLSDSLMNINACSNPTKAYAMMIASDLQDIFGRTVSLTMNGVTSSFPKTFWNSEVVSTNVTQNQNKSMFGISVFDSLRGGPWDCYSWVMFGLYYQANATNISLSPKTTTICPGDTVTITASSNDGTGSFEWSSIPAGFSGNSASIKVSPDKTTSYFIKRFNSYTCFCQSDTVKVIVFPKIYAHAGQNQSICRGSSVQIGMLPTGGTPPYNISWTPIDSLKGVNAARPIVNPSVTTKYYVTVMDSNGCRNRDSVIVTVLDNPIAHAGPDIKTCINIPVTIGGNATGGAPPYVYSWTPSTFLNVSNQPVVQAKVSDTTMFVVTVTDSNGCVGKDSVFVYPMPLPKFKIIPGGPTTICSCDSVTLNADNFDFIDYKWTYPDANTVIARTQIITVKKTGWYRVTVTNINGCKNKDSIYIRVYPVPTVKSVKSMEICKGVPQELSIKITDGTPPFKYKWSPSTGLSADNIANPLASPDYFTKYIVTVTDSAGCVAYDTINVNVNERPVSNAGKDTTICLGSSVNLSGNTKGGTPPYKYLWNPNIGLNKTDSSTVIASPLTTTHYILTVTDSKGCSSFDTVIVNVSIPVKTKIKPLSSTNICDGDSVILKAEPYSSAYKYSWSTGETSEQITIKKSGKVILTAQNEYGCKTSDTIEISVHKLQDIKITTDKPPYFCEGDSIKLTAEPQLNNYSYRWSTGDTTLSITVKKSGTYILRAEDGSGCSISDSIIVKIEGYLVTKIDAGGPTIICGENLLLKAIPKGKEYTYLWSTGETTDEITVNKSGRYWLKVSLGKGCEGSDTIDVKLYPKPSVKISGPSSLCKGNAVTLSSDKPFLKYLWSTGDTTRTISIIAGGKYFITATDTNGCMAKDSVIIREDSISITGLTNVDLGKICSGEEDYKDITIGNESSAIAVIKDIKFNNAISAFSTGAYPNTVPAGSRESIRIFFKPKDIGYYNDSIIFEFSEPCYSIYKTEVKGTAYAKTLASLPVITAKIGDYIEIPLSLKLLCGGSIPDNSYYKSEISLDETALLPGKVIQDNGVQFNGINGDSISFSINSQADKRISIKGMAMLAKYDTIPLIIDSFKWDNELIENENQNGTLILNGLCQRNLLRVMYLQSTFVTIIPSPASEEAEIKVTGEKTGRAEISIFTLEGIKKNTIELNKSGFELSYKVNLNEYGQGCYQIVAKLGGDIVFTRMMIIK